MSKWFAVTERLPPKFVDVPVVAGRAVYFAHRVSEDNEAALFAVIDDHDRIANWVRDPYVEGVTHWFELPPVPVEAPATSPLASNVTPAV